MPASRQRTQRWRESLAKIHERGGGLELTIDRGDDALGGDLVWRVRLLGIRPDRLVVEHPGAMGMSFPVRAGARLIGIMAVGQNRWMFHTEVLAVNAGEAGAQQTLEIATPTGVERCMRRTFDRIRTASVSLPPVECWTLLEPATARAAEIACRTQLLDHQDADVLRMAGDACEAPLLPEVGQRYQAELANIGGGGVGLRFTREHAPGLDARRAFWLRIDLRPVLGAPLAASARLAHTHIDSAQNHYAGMAFDFQHHPEHKAFVLDQIRRYFELTQAKSAA